MPFEKISKNVIKLFKNPIFKKVYLPLKPTWRSWFFLFHSHHPKPKQNHQISSSGAKTRSTRSQACVMYKGNIICIRRNTDVNTDDLKILHKRCPNKVDFPDVIFNFFKIWCGLPSTLFLTGELWPLRFKNNKKNLASSMSQKVISNYMTKGRNKFLIKTLFTFLWFDVFCR